MADRETTATRLWLTMLFALVAMGATLAVMAWRGQLDGLGCGAC